MGSLSSKNLFILKLANLTARRHHHHSARLSYSFCCLPTAPLNLFNFQTFEIVLSIGIFYTLMGNFEERIYRLSNCLVEIRGLDTVILCPHSPSPHSLPLSSPAGIHTWVMGLPQQVARWWSEGRRRKGGVWGCVWCWSTSERERGRWRLEMGGKKATWKMWRVKLM